MKGRLLKHAAGSLLGRGTIDEAAIVYSAIGNRPGLMVDVGAHHGGALRPFAEAGWRVLAFEPDPANRRVLEEQCATLPNVTVDERAVSNKDGEIVQLYASGVSSGISTLFPFHESHVPSATVETVTLATRIDEEIDFLKIDTEGFDLFVLQGLNWARHRPRVVVCEFEDGKTERLGYRYEDLASFLRDRGYLVLVSEWFPVVEYGARHRWRRFATYPAELSDPAAWGNLIAAASPDDFHDLKAAAGRKRIQLKLRRLADGLRRR